MNTDNKKGRKKRNCITGNDLKSESSDIRVSLIGHTNSLINHIPHSDITRFKVSTGARLEPFYSDILVDELIGKRDVPNHLYHYTTVETLSLILESATIRFNRLDKVNDAEEAISSDLPFSNTTQFVSCWTDENSELIPLWEMYTKMVGVRIRMPTNMFLGRPEPVLYEYGGFITSLKKFYLIKRDIFGLNTSQLFGPSPMYYTDRQDLLHPSILFDAGDPYHENIPHAKVEPLDLGCAKSTHWAFEKEWRYKLSLFSIGQYIPLDDIGNANLDLANNPVRTDYIDVDLDRSAFREMEILLGPKISKKNRTQVHSVVKRFADYSTVKIENSCLRVR